MLRAARWALVGLGLLLLLGGGASLFWDPAHEVLFDLDAPLTTCTASGCAGLYRLEVGNTGREAQPQVLVRLRAPILQTAMLAPRVLDFGKSERSVEVAEAEGVRTYALGRLRPGDRVEVRIIFLRRDPGALPTWEQIFLAVEPAQGRAYAGHPAATMLLRVWYAILRIF